MRTIAVAGPRELGTNAFHVALSIDRYFANAPDKYIVLHGNARGVDLICAEAAERHGHIVRAFPVNDEDRAKAKAQGKPRKAPLWRTRRMLDEKPEWLMAWWDGVSTGTGFTITECKRRRIPFYTLPVNADATSSGMIGTP